MNQFERLELLVHEKIDDIYFSAWENDYFPDPFISFSKEIIRYINKNSKTKLLKQKAETIFKKIKKVATAIPIKTNYGEISIGSLIDAFVEPKDPIVEFKKELKQYIKKKENKRLIIIVDELDRCRPDYAMKVLECIKHFFDVEGLFIIVPTNKKSLTDSITALYGISDTTKHKECYYKKFFNDERKIKEPTVEDYEIILKEYINRKSLKVAINKKLITTEDGFFNSLDVLLSSLAVYCQKIKLSIRETKNIAEEICRMS